jgi:hypothetical protein
MIAFCFLIKERKELLHGHNSEMAQGVFSGWIVNNINTSKVFCEREKQ